MRLNEIEVDTDRFYIQNLNTASVEVKLSFLGEILKNGLNLNTASVEVKWTTINIREKNIHNLNTASVEVKLLKGINC